MKKLKALDLSVAILATVSCLLITIDVPVWSLFIGWAWYYTLGADLKVFSQATPPMIAGSLLAIAAFIVIEFLSPFMPSLVATMIAVFFSVTALMMVLKLPAFSTSLVAFNGYSCVFVGYASNTYMSIDGWPPLLCAFIWITGANFLGLVFGWYSLRFEQHLKKIRQLQ